MHHLNHALSVLLPLAYGCALVCYVSYFRTKAGTAGRLASRVLLGGLILHIVHLVVQGLHAAHFPVTNPIESLSLLSFSVGLIYYVTERTVREGNTGMFFVVIVFLFQVVASMFVGEGKAKVDDLLSNPMYGFHASLTILGVSALAVACLYGMMYLMLSGQIKKHRFGVIYDRLPPLDKLEGMANYATSVGLFVLGGGILLGHIWSARAMGEFFPLDAKILLTDLTFAVYVAFYVYVRRSGWRGRRIGQFAFWSFIAYFSSMMVLNIFVHSFHRFA